MTDTVNGTLPFKESWANGVSQKRGQEIPSQKEEQRLSVEKRGLGEKTSIMNSKDPRPPPIVSVLVHIPARQTCPGRLLHIIPLDLRPP